MLNYLKRRFSSTELINEIRSGVGYGTSQNQQAQQQQQNQYQQCQQGSQQQPQRAQRPGQADSRQTVEDIYTQKGATVEKGPRAPFPSAPSSPTRQPSALSGSGMGGGGGGTGGGFMNTVTGQLSKAKHLFSTETLNSIISDVKVPGVTGGSKCKILLVIDHPLTDWAKYVHKRKIDGEWDVRVEQAQLNDISIMAYPDQGCVVTVQDGKGSRSSARTFKPDFVLMRQALGAATQHYENLVTGLMFGSVPCMNSVEAIYNMRNKAWLFSNLLKIQKRLGSTDFPLIPRSYQSKSQPLNPDFQMPVAVRLGGDSARECEVRVEDVNLYQSLMSLANNTQRYATTEPCIQRVCEVFIQKIGPFTKAFMRKPISNPSFNSSGSTVLEKIPMTTKFNQWIIEISQMFGGLDMCAIKALQDTKGDYFIQDVYGSDFILLGDGQEEDRARIAELLLQRMEHAHKFASGTARRASQSAVSQTSNRAARTSTVSPPVQVRSVSQSAYTPSPPAQEPQGKSTFGQERPPIQQQQQQMDSSTFLTQSQPSKPQHPPSQQSISSMQSQSSRQHSSSSSSTQEQLFKQQPSMSQSSSFSMQEQQRAQKSQDPGIFGSDFPTTSRPSMPGASMDFGQSKPSLRSQQNVQSSSSRFEVPRNDFNKRDTFNTTSPESGTPSMDFSSSQPSASGMSFGMEADDKFGFGSSSGSLSKSATEAKPSAPWSTEASSRPTGRESSLDGSGSTVRARPQKEAAPQPPRQQDNSDTRNFDSHASSTASSTSITSTNIFDPSANIFQSQAQNKATMSSFQSRDSESPMKFDSPSMDFGQSSFKSPQNDPWSVPQSQTPICQTSTFTSSSSSFGTTGTSNRPRQTSQEASSNQDDADDTMKNLRKTFAGIFGDI